MPGAGRDFLAHHGFDRLCAFFIIQEGSRTFARQSHHDAQPVTLGDVEQPSGRRGIGAHRVEPVSGHQSKILLDDLRAGEFVALSVGAKSAIGDATNVKLRITNEKEFAPHARTLRYVKWKGSNASALSSKSTQRNLRVFNTPGIHCFSPPPKQLPCFATEGPTCSRPQL